MNPTDQINLRQRAKKVLDKLPAAEILAGLERIEKSYWKTLCDLFERLTGESLDDADSKKQYHLFASLVKIWAERRAEWKRSDPDNKEPQICRPENQSDLRRAERAAWMAADSYLDQISHESWSDDGRSMKSVDPETKKYLAVISAVDDWAVAMCEVRIAQEEDGARWGQRIVQFESAKVKRFRPPSVPR